MTPTGPQYDKAQTDSLSEISSLFANASGHIELNDPADPTEVLARDDGSSYQIYTESDSLYVGDTFGLCTLDTSGGLDTCAEIIPAWRSGDALIR